MSSHENMFSPIIQTQFDSPVMAPKQVHFDCLYRGITAVSSRESKLLAGNRIIAQVVKVYDRLHDNTE